MRLAGAAKPAADIAVVSADAWPVAICGRSRPCTTLLAPPAGATPARLSLLEVPLAALTNAVVPREAATAATRGLCNADGWPPASQQLAMEYAAGSVTLKSAAQVMKGVDTGAPLRCCC